MSILIIAEHDNQTLKPSLANLLTAAKQLGAEIDVLVIGHQCSDVASAAAKFEGVTKVKIAEAEYYQHQLAEEISPLICQVADAYSHILCAAGTFGKNVLPRVAAKLDVQCLSDVCAIVSDDTFLRPIYAGNVIAKVKCREAKKLLSIRTTSFDVTPEATSSAAVEVIAASAEQGLSQFVSEQVAVNDRPELGSAKVVVSGGRGLGSAENFDLLYQLADKLNAAVGASRAAVDAGYVPNDLQVGQTGKIVAPQLYIAVGISGAIQHLAGMKESKVIVAVNKDEDAPIFQVADYGLVADLFDVLPELTGKL